MYQVITISKEIMEHLRVSALKEVKDYGQLDSILGSYAKTCHLKDIEHDQFRLVAFAVVMHGSKILVAKRHGEMILGFGGQVIVKQEMVGQSIKAHVITTLHQEIERYIPETPYRINIQGLIYCERRDYDRQNIGCLFLAETLEPIKPKVVDGKVISMYEIGSLDESSLKGWSAIIHQHFLERVYSKESWVLAEAALKVAIQ
ncbi:MAG: hypothetical protein C0415_05925 [Thermodesulfovibrio sp.]|nr:hypothetical protein [Thermodesulfovibrio sp.]